MPWEKIQGRAIFGFTFNLTKVKQNKAARRGQRILLGVKTKSRELLRLRKVPVTAAWRGGIADRDRVTADVGGADNHSQRHQ